MAQGKVEWQFQLASSALIKRRLAGRSGVIQFGWNGVPETASPNGVATVSPLTKAHAEGLSIVPMARRKSGSKIYRGPAETMRSDAGGEGTENLWFAALSLLLRINGRIFRQICFQRACVILLEPGICPLLFLSREPGIFIEANLHAIVCQGDL